MHTCNLTPLHIGVYMGSDGHTYMHVQAKWAGGVCLDGSSRSLPRGSPFFAFLFSLGFRICFLSPPSSTGPGQAGEPAIAYTKLLFNPVILSGPPSPPSRGVRFSVHAFPRRADRRAGLLLTSSLLEGKKPLSKRSSMVSRASGPRFKCRSWR